MRFSTCAKVLVGCQSADSAEAVLKATIERCRLNVAGGKEEAWERVMAERGSERDDNWHRREYVRRLHQNRERGLAGGKVPTVDEIKLRERGPVLEWLQTRQTPEKHRKAHRRTTLLIAAGIALGGAALALKCHSFAAKGRLAHQQPATGASR